MMKSTILPISLLSLTVLVGCNSKESDFYAKEIAPLAVPAGTSEVLPKDDVLVNDTSDPADTVKHPSVPLCKDGTSSDLICNPLGNDAIVDVYMPDSDVSNLGLIGYLYEGQVNFNELDRYFSEGVKHPSKIYFNNFNVPTRRFDEGFGLGDSYLKNASGEKLVEWFAISVSGNILLPKDKEEGFYHIMTLSDDGIRIKVSGKEILAHTGVHAPTLDCASQLIELKKGVEQKFELQYFQGPKYHIALVAMIKKVDDPATFNLQEGCASKFDYEAPAKIGYEVVSPSWFTLPLENR